MSVDRVVVDCTVAERELGHWRVRPSTLSIVPDRYRQRVPRPSGVVTRRPPPWAGLADWDHVVLGVNDVAAAVAGGSFIDVHAPVGTPRAAVLAAVHDIEGDAQLVLIRRATHLQGDPGLMALPGGHVDPGETAEDAALREADEEIGLQRTAVTQVLPFACVRRARDRHTVASFVGILSDRPALRANPDEVDEIIEVRLAALLGDGVGWSERWEHDGGDPRDVRFFAAPHVLGDDLIWGMTARILWLLLERLAQRVIGGCEPSLD